MAFTEVAVIQSRVAVSVKASMDILRDQNTCYLQMVKQIEELYNKAEKDTIEFKYPFGKEMDKLDLFLNKLPQEAWIQ